MLNEKLIRIQRPLRPPSSLSPSLLPPKYFKLPVISKLSKTPRIDLSQTQKSDLAHTTRFNTPDPKHDFSSIKPILPQLYNLSSFSSSLDRQVINLEKLIIQEEKLSKIIENIDQPSQMHSVLVDYWETSADETLWNIEKLFKDSRTKKLIQVSIVVEAVVVSLMIFLYSSLYGFNGKTQQIKNMMTQAHQNFLTIVELILNKLPEAANTVWVNKLQDVVAKKKFRTLKRAENSTTLKHNCDIIVNCLKNLTHLLPSGNGNVLVVNQVLANLDKYSVENARNLLKEKTGVCQADLSAGTPVGLAGKGFSKELTLVLDLDETLVHYSSHKVPGTLLVRPFCEEFLKEMGQSFDVVIFTAGVQEYADWAIDLIDISNVTKLRLYRQHTSMKSGSYVKDLAKLGRDLAKIIIVDNVQGNFQMQPDNGILIKSWIGDPADNELRSLSNLLKRNSKSEIAISKDNDVRVSLKKLRALNLL